MTIAPLTLRKTDEWDRMIDIFGSGHEDSRNFVLDFYKMAIRADAIAQAIA